MMMIKRAGTATVNWTKESGSSHHGRASINGRNVSILAMSNNEATEKIHCETIAFVRLHSNIKHRKREIDIIHYYGGGYPCLSRVECSSFGLAAASLL